MVQLILQIAVLKYQHLDSDIVLEICLDSDIVSEIENLEIESIIEKKGYILDKIRHNIDNLKHNNAIIQIYSESEFQIQSSKNLYAFRQTFKC
jgi:hypothetical protein